MRYPRRLSVAGSALLVCLSGCGGMSLDDVSSPEPEFDFIGFFEGHTRASGWFADRFGKVRRHFCGDFIGRLDGDKLVLDETLYYTDGVLETRVWTVSVGSEGEFTATSDSLNGDATGQIRGNTLAMKYSMNVLLSEDREAAFSMDDFMFYQPDGSLHNFTHVKKWGLRLGSVSTQYLRHDGDDGCEAAAARIDASLAATR